jgi:hypothetical protein
VPFYVQATYRRTKSFRHVYHTWSLTVMLRPHVAETAHKPPDCAVRFAADAQAVADELAANAVNACGPALVGGRVPVSRMCLVTGGNVPTVVHLFRAGLMRCVP